MKNITKNLLKTVFVATILLLAFSACATAAAGGNVVMKAEDGSYLIASFADSSGWNPEYGGMSMREGLLTFTTEKMGDFFRVDGRFRFPSSVNISEFAKGYLQVEVMVSDVRMLDCQEATMALSSADFNYLKWKWNETGSFDRGLSPQVPTESGVWTLLTLPLYKSSWEDEFVGNLIFTRVNRLDFYMIGIPVEGSVHFRNLKVVTSP